MLNQSGILIIIILLFFLICFLRSKSLENFITLTDNTIIPSNCYNYLLTNGSKFFLLNTKKIVDNISNPLVFNTKQDAMNYLNNNTSCSNKIPFVNLVMKKKNNDPTVSYERQCNKEVAPNLFDIDVCNQYGTDNDILTNKYLNRLNEIQNDKNTFADYNVETCMMNKVMKDEPGLEDSNFKTYFSKYFDNLNSNIDEKFLYMTN